jgi:hypothetical protein
LPDHLWPGVRDTTAGWVQTAIAVAGLAAIVWCSPGSSGHRKFLLVPYAAVWIWMIIMCIQLVG